jgi:hypothetical protein
MQKERRWDHRITSAAINSAMVVMVVMMVIVVPMKPSVMMVMVVMIVPRQPRLAAGIFRRPRIVSFESHHRVRNRLEQITIACRRGEFRWCWCRGLRAGNRGKRGGSPQETRYFLVHASPPGLKNF